MNLQKPPPIPADLLAWLEATVPAAPPRLSDSDREVWFNAGKRDLVEFLKAHAERQRRDVLSPSHL